MTRHTLAASGLAAAILLTLGGSAAAQPLPAGQVSRTWTQIVDFKDSVVDVDQASIRRSGQKVTAMVRTRILQAGLAPFDQVVATTTFYCAEHADQDLHVDYYLKGSLLRSTEPGEKHPVRQGSRGDYIIAAICGR